MKCVLSQQPYQWQDDSGAWGVGRLVLVPYDNGNDCVVCANGGLMTPDFISKSVRVQVMPSHSHLPVFVEWGRLSPYPASPIPEPSNTGTTSEIA